MSKKYADKNLTYEVNGLRNYIRDLEINHESKLIEIGEKYNKIESFKGVVISEREFEHYQELKAETNNIVSNLLKKQDLIFQFMDAITESKSFQFRICNDRFKNIKDEFTENLSDALDIMTSKNMVISDMYFDKKNRTTYVHAE